MFHASLESNSIQEIKEHIKNANGCSNILMNLINDILDF